jgi:Skp family chaperone for outer membrane proteins
MNKPIIICCLLVALGGCFGSERKLQELEAKVRQQEQFIQEYQQQEQELADLKSRVQAIQKVFSGVLERLDRLDERLYQGSYLKALRDRHARRDELIDGYISLIERLERDTAAK